MPVVMFLLAVLLLCSLVLLAKSIWDSQSKREFCLWFQWVPLTMGTVWLLWWLWPVVVRYLGY